MIKHYSISLLSPHIQTRNLRRRGGWITASQATAAGIPCSEMFALQYRFAAGISALLSITPCAIATARRGKCLRQAEGPDHGRALLLVHGQTGAWQDYARVLPELSKNWHVFAVDCYGHGGSSHDEKKYYLDANGDDLIWFIGHVIGKETVGSGHSSGGLLAAYVAAYGGDRVVGALPTMRSSTTKSTQKSPCSISSCRSQLIACSFTQSNMICALVSISMTIPGTAASPTKA